MKKLAYIIAFFALLGYAQTRYLHFYDDKYEFFEYCFDIYYDIFWPAEYLDSFAIYPSFNDDTRAISIINIDSSGVLFDYGDTCLNYKYISNPRKHSALAFYDLKDSVFPPLIVQMLEGNGGLIYPTGPTTPPKIPKYHFGILTIEKENYSDSLWIAPKGYIPDSTKALDFRNDFLESRQFADSVKQEKYFHTSHSFYNDSMGNMSLNFRIKDDSLFFIYKKDTSYAVCYNDYEYVRYRSQVAVTDGNICEIYDNNDTSCLKGTSYRTDKYEYLSKHVFTCKQVNENELAYRLVEKLTIPFELDTLYQNFDKTPQPILKNKNSIKTYSPAIYRVNGTNSKKNKSSNVLYGKERAVRYLRKE